MSGTCFPQAIHSSIQWCRSIHLEALLAVSGSLDLQFAVLEKEEWFELLLRLLLPPRQRFQCFTEVYDYHLLGFTSSVTMWKQSSSRNHGGKRLRPGHCLQVFLLLAVGIWLMYQLGHCYKRRAVAVEIGGSRGVDGKPIRRRWLDRKSLIKFADVVSREVASGITGDGITARNDDTVERKPTTDKVRKETNKGSEDEGDEEDDGLFGYDGDDSNFHPENGSGGQDDVADQLVHGAANGSSNLSRDSPSGVFQWQLVMALILLG